MRLFRICLAFGLLTSAQMVRAQTPTAEKAVKPAPTPQAQAPAKPVPVAPAPAPAKPGPAVQAQGPPTAVGPVAQGPVAGKPASAVPAQTPAQPGAAPPPATPAPGQLPPGAAPAAAAPAGPIPISPSSDTYVYRAEGRRDPFLTLIGTGAIPRDASHKDGPAGMTVGEISVRGILQSKGALVAMIQGPDTKTYIVHQGDKLFDGVIKTITPQGLIVIQEVNDPLSLVRQREVRKLLRSLEDAKE
jgi:hypothetical protein